jgi:hypothetical protein
VSLRTLLVVAAGVVALLAVGWWVRSERADFPAREAAGTGPAATEPRAGIDASVVAGRWQRLEGGYVLDIASVAADGAMTVAYLNPRSINVSAARASQAGDAIEVFVELRDVNYPGATYRLTYDAATDRLAGTYHQPALGQSFDVVFVRARP